MTMSKTRLLLPLLGLLAGATTQGCGNGASVNGGTGGSVGGTGGVGSGGSVASSGGNSGSAGSAGMGGSASMPSHKVTIVGSGS